MLTWRELSLNFCLRNPRHGTLAALPEWVQRSMRAHADDEREVTYSLEELEGAATHDAIWNAGQRELVETGQMHNVVRMLWGKSVITWTETYEQALAWLLHLNNKYGLDGRDPNSFAGIQWCFGKFDRPFASRPVWGTIRPMSLERAHSKYDVARYIARWNGAKEGELALA
jgi:deoxyribodipyrimidine photo-lyase